MGMTRCGFGQCCRLCAVVAGCHELCRREVRRGRALKIDRVQAEHHVKLLGLAQRLRQLRVRAVMHVYVNNHQPRVAIAYACPARLWYCLEPTPRGHNVTMPQSMKRAAGLPNVTPAFAGV